MKRYLCLFLSFAVFLSLLAGCSAAPKPYVPSGNGLANDDGTTKPPPTDPDAPEQELTLAYYAEKPLNPLKSADFTNTVLFSLMFQGLFAVDENCETYPVLCKNYSVSKDMKTWIFYPEQATFSDGSILTQEDVYASLKCAIESDLYKGRFAHVVNINRSTDGGVVIKLDISCESLPMLLTIPILKKDEIYSNNPVGTGPYYMETITSGPRLRRRIDWWCDAEMVLSASSIPLVRATTPSQIRDNFEFYDVGLVCADPCSDTYADYMCDYELWDCDNGAYLYIGCNMESRVFSNLSVRSALTFAIDRDYLVEKYYRGFAKAATLPCSPDAPWYSRSLAKRYAYEPQKFSEALSAAGMLGSEIRILVNKDDSMRLTSARAIRDMLQACGLIVTMKELNGQDYMDCLIYRTYDLYVGQTRLSPNMDMSAFFRRGGALRYGELPDAALYNYCLEAMANEGNYYNLHKAVADDGRVTSVLFHSYAIYATRGLLTDLTPARDNVFFYKLDKTMRQVQVDFAEPEYMKPDNDLSVYMVTASSGLNIRTNPSTNSDVVVRIPYGTEVIPEKWSGNWAYVEYRGQYGWCSANYLRLIREGETAPDING